MGENPDRKYVSDNAQLMTEWNWEKNMDVLPSKVALGSNKKIWWKCNLGHEWQSSPNHRNNGRNCPYCSSKKVLVGYNDLQTVNPILTREWNYEKNDGLTPADVMPNSDKKVWWKCSNSHEWQATIGSRHRGSGCPYCAGQKILKGYNDLQTVNPSLAVEWDFEKNNPLTPADVMPNSIKLAWWVCCKGHQWQASISNRNRGAGCPCCAGQQVIKGYNDLQTVNPLLAVEWDFEKNNGLTPIDVMANSGKKAWWKCQKGHNWQAKIASRNSGIGCPICDSERKTSFPEYAIEYYLKRYGLEVIHSYKGNGYELDIYVPSKKVAIEYDGYYWHRNKTKKDLEKNNHCQKDNITLYRIREELLPLNDSSIDYIVRKNKKDLPEILEAILSEIVGINVDVNIERDSIAIENLRECVEKDNSLFLSNPNLACEWNYEKNGNLHPRNFTVKSGKKVWWKCKENHEWEASIAHRSNGTGCPYCAGKKVLSGYNDLLTIDPLLAMEWNYECNSGLKPEDFTANSGKKVWWKCSQGHEWEATINNRHKHRRCPYCATNGQ